MEADNVFKELDWYVGKCCDAGCFAGPAVLAVLAS
jgi:hypothetical protein